MAVDLGEYRAANSVLLDRLEFLRSAGITSFGGRRDYNEIFGYPATLSNIDYRIMYARHGIAKRIVEAFPNATWRGGAELVEKESSKITTPFEKTWEELEKRLHVWQTLKRTDILAGLSTYSVLLIGAPGNLSDELPRGKAENILYLKPFSGGGGPGLNTRLISNTTAVDADATIKSFILDPQDERFGLPEFYQIRRIDPVSPSFQVPIHWSRIIHIAEGCLDDDIFGQPTLENVYNLLLDLLKVTGGGSEAYWLRASPGLQLDVDKDMTLDTVEKQALKDQADEYQHQLRRMLRTRGVKVNQLGSDVANFSNPADAIMTQIAGSKGIPRRILQGSEEGSLASDQDRTSWQDQIRGRQEGHAESIIIRPLVDRLIKYGYLPTPTDYDVVWPDSNILTLPEKSAGALSWAQTNAAQGTPIFTADETRDFWFSMEPLPKPKLDAQGQPVSEDGVPLAPTKDPKTGLPIKQVPAPVLGKHPETGLPVEVDTKTGQPANAGKKNPFLKAAEHSFSSTQVNLPEELAQAIYAFGQTIPADILAADGREDDIHITLKYGIHTTDPTDVRAALKGVGPITLTLGAMDRFEAPDYDVLIITVDSPDLVYANAKVSRELAVTDTHPVYQPHVTIAYLKPGWAKQYVGDSRFAGLAATVQTVIFSSADDKIVPITTLCHSEIETLSRSQKAVKECDDEIVKYRTIYENLRELGGSGSGYHGHAGRPGKVGGSSDLVGTADYSAKNVAGKTFTVETNDHAFYTDTGGGSSDIGRPEQAKIFSPDEVYQLLQNVSEERVRIVETKGGRHDFSRFTVDPGVVLGRVHDRANDDVYDDEKLSWKGITSRSASSVEDHDTELLHILEAAIVANNTSVIDAILGIRHVGKVGGSEEGIRHARFDPDEARDKNGMWTDSGDSLGDYPKIKMSEPKERIPKPADFKHPQSHADAAWIMVAPHQGESAGVKFANAFEHHHQINLAKPKFLSVVAALTGFSDMGRAIGLEGSL